MLHRPTRVTVIRRAIQLHEQRTHQLLNTLLLRLEVLRLSITVRLQPCHTCLEVLLRRLAILLAQLLLRLLLTHRVARIVEIRLQVILRLDLLHVLLVVLGILLRRRHHLLNLLLGKTALVIRDSDLVRLAAALLHRRHIENTVRIHIIGDLNLRDTARHRRNTIQTKLAEQIVVARHRALTLKDEDVNRRLVIRIRRECLRLLRGDGRVALDERRHDTARRLNAEGQRRNVQQKELAGAVVLAVALREDVRLDRRAIGYRLIRIHTVVQLLATKIVAQKLADTRDARGAADHYNLVNLLLGHLGVAEEAVQRSQAALEEGVAQALKLRARERHLEILAVRQRIHLNRGLCGGGQVALGALAGRAEAAQGLGVVLQINLCLLLELADAVVHEDVVKVLAAEVSIPCSRLDLKDAAINCQNT